MNFDEYDRRASRTAVYPGQGVTLSAWMQSGQIHDILPGLMYTALGLGGEAGETLEQVKKIYRDDHGNPPQERIDRVKKELGDVLWYVAACAREVGATLDEIATMNIEKLEDRAIRGQIHGSGDDR